MSTSYRVCSNDITVGVNQWGGCLHPFIVVNIWQTVHCDFKLE